MTPSVTLPDTEYQRRIDAVRAAMDEQEYDVFVVYADEYRPGDAFYLSNFKPINVLEEAHQLVVVPRDSEPLMVTGTLNSYAATERTWIDDVRPFTEMTDALEEVRDRVGGTPTVGLAGEGLLPVKEYDVIESVFDAETIERDGALLARLRQHKSDAEMAMLEASARVAEESLVDAVEALETGMTETELAATSEYGARRRDAEIGSDYVIMAGENTEYPTWRPHPDHRIEDGDYVIIDASPALRGYAADVALTAIAGEGDEERVETLRWANQTVRDVVADDMYPGMAAEELFECVVARVRRAGFEDEFLPWAQGVRAVGHGVGIDVVEWPNLGPGTDVTLDPGTVLSLKLDLHGIDGGGLRVERMVAVEDGGVRGLNFVDHSTVPESVRRFV